LSKICNVDGCVGPFVDIEIRK